MNIFDDKCPEIAIGQLRTYCEPFQYIKGLD